MPLISKTILPHFSSSVLYLYSTSFKPFPIQPNPPFPTIRATHDNVPFKTSHLHIFISRFIFSSVFLYRYIFYFL